MTSIQKTPKFHHPSKFSPEIQGQNDASLCPPAYPTITCYSGLSEAEYHLSPTRTLCLLIPFHVLFLNLRITVLYGTHCWVDGKCLTISASLTCLPFSCFRFLKSRAALINRSKMWAIYVTSNFLVATLKNEKETGETNFSHIFYLNINKTLSFYKTKHCHYKMYSI